MKTIKSKKITGNTLKKVVFFFPFKVVSGGPIYLSNLATELSKKPDYSVAYIDYKDGVARKLLKRSKVVMLNYDDQIVFKLFPEDEIYLITPIYWGNRVPIMNPRSKVVFFNWHNLCIPSLRENLQCSNEILSCFLESVSRNNAEFYCDKAHWNAQEQFGISFKEIYVPITIPERKVKAKAETVDDDFVNIAVVGRLVVDKIYAIMDLVDNVSNSRRYRSQVNIYVIGDGDQKENLENYPRPEWINLIFCGTLSIEEINKLIVEKTDVLFAMGTSALEGAAAGLPTVIIPNDINPFKCNRYSYLYECNSFLLGWGPDQIDIFGIETHPLDEIIENIYAQGKKYEIGNLCLAYYRRNHMSNIEWFIDAFTKSTLTYDEYYNTIVKVSASAKEWAKNNILKVIGDDNRKNIVIWGAGKGGKRLLTIMKKFGIKVDYYVDKNAEMLVEYIKVPVKKPDILDPSKDIVFISLLTYVCDIPDMLEKMGFVKNDNFLYVYFPNY